MNHATLKEILQHEINSFMGKRWINIHELPALIDLIHRVLSSCESKFTVHPIILGGAIYILFDGNGDHPSFLIEPRLT